MPSDATNSAASERMPEVAQVPARRLTVIETAALGLLAIASVGLLYVGRPVLLPLAAALLLSFVLRPAARLLGRMHVPMPVSALLTVPALVCVKVLLERVDAVKPLARILD